MAKGRRAAALFEVIHRGTLTPVKRRPVLQMPAFARLAFWRKGAASESAVATAQPVGPAPAPRLAQFIDEAPADIPHRHRPVDVRVDRDRQDVLLRFSYHSAGITAFAIVVALLLAFVVGRMNRGPAQAIGQSTDKVKAGSVHPTVGNLTRQNGETPAAPAPDAHLAGARTPGLVVEEAQRTNNLNYYVLLSLKDEKKALEAVEFLSKYDVKASVEKDCTGFAGLYCVVGMTGFAQPSGREATHYKEEVMKLTQKVAGIRVVPAAIKWREVK